MDWHFADNEKWQALGESLNSAGVEAMQVEWDEMLGEKKEEVVEGVKVRKLRRKRNKT